MGYWDHAWTCDQVLVKKTGEQDKTLQEYIDFYPTLTYQSQGQVSCFCIFCNYQMPVVYWPPNHRLSDIGPDVPHKDQNGAWYLCTELPEPDPQAVWIEDEDGLAAIEAADDNAKTKSGRKKK